MEQRIVFENENGMSIIIPSPDYDGSLDDLARKLVPSGTPFFIINTDNLPQDRTFRSAWKYNGGNVNVDMEKAREIHMNKIRAIRDAELAKLDIETMKGKDVQVEKQILRDLPQTIDLSVAKTPEELKNIMPDILKGK